MNDTAWQTGGPLVDGGPLWLTASFVLIGLGVLFALFILAWGTRLAKKRAQARAELDERGEIADQVAPATELRETAPPAAPSPPPVAPSPPPSADVPVMTPPATPEPEPAEPAPLADEPIAAAAPLDASPATLAASEPAAHTGEDQLTRMKGVGPKLAERLNALGITRFEQIAALTPEEASALDAQLGTFQGRMQRDRWIEQAGYLARGDQAGYEAVFGKL